MWEYIWAPQGRGSHWLIKMLINKREINLAQLSTHSRRTDLERLSAQMATVDSIQIASEAAVDIGGHPTRSPRASNIDLPSPPSDADEQQPHIADSLHLDEGEVNVRTKIRILAIVAALYVVLFIAALDQTIIA